MGGLLAKFASLAESISRRSGREPVRRSPSWLDARSDAAPDEPSRTETQTTEQIDEAEAALRLLARLRAPQPPAWHQRLQLAKHLGTIRRPTWLGTILLTAVALLVSFLVSLMAMDLLSPRDATPGQALAELPPLPPASR